MAENASPDDIFKILVATDIHLGYAEQDSIRGGDSFNTFEEILQIAQENEVDLLLLGGDLFHDTRPSSLCMHRCMALLREYCMGDRPIAFEILSDPNKDFENTAQEIVNYQDPNINVSLPVFSIHGNHDDPTGQNAICSLDILSCTGLVNFFGKGSDLKQVQVSPLLLQKGESRLAIYGFGHIKDCRLYRMFESGQVTFFRPDEYQDEWFNVGVIHQNRAQNRGVKNTIPEDFLPEFLDLVIWGHEHNCRIEPEFVPRRNFYVSQPGSSVATSLSEGESIPKKVGLLKVHKKEFLMEFIELQTVRPFIYDELSTSELADTKLHNGEQQAELAHGKVEEMIQRATGRLTGHPKQPTLPLIRLCFFYLEEGQMFNAIRFGQKFEDRVANPSDMIKMCRLKVRKAVKEEVVNPDAMITVMTGLKNWNVRVEDYIKKYFQDLDGDESLSLTVLTASGLCEATASMVEGKDSQAFTRIINHQTTRMHQYLMTKDVNQDNIDDEIRNFSNQRKAAGATDSQETVIQCGRMKNDNKDQDEVEAAVEAAVEVPVGRGSPAAKAPPAPRARGRPRATTNATSKATSKATPKATSRAASRAASNSTSSRGRGRGRAAPQRTLHESFATQASQISVNRTLLRADVSRVQFEDSDDD